MNAGFHIWSIDADSVVLDDFVERTLKFTAEPIKADVMLALNEPHRLETAANIGKRIPKLNMGILYLRNTLGSRHFLVNIQKKLEENSGLVDQDAMEKVVGDESLVTITGLGLSKDDLYPSMHMGGGGLSGPLSPRGTRLQVGRQSQQEEGDITQLTKDSLSQQGSPSSSSTSRYSLGKLLSALHRRPVSSSEEGSSYHSSSTSSSDKSNSEDSSPLLPDSALTRIHLLDQLEFLNGALLKESLPGGGRSSSPKILHVGKGLLDPEKVLRSKGFWFIDTQGRCIEKRPFKVDGMKVDSKEAMKKRSSEENSKAMIA
jgi:hypothetical protein